MILDFIHDMLHVILLLEKLALNNENVLGRNILKEIFEDGIVI